MLKAVVLSEMPEVHIYFDRKGFQSLLKITDLMLGGAYISLFGEIRVLQVEF
jgi:hypothetical protein